MEIFGGHARTDLKKTAKDARKKDSWFNKFTIKSLRLMYENLGFLFIRHS